MKKPLFFQAMKLLPLFMVASLTSKITHAEEPSGYVMHIQMVPAICMKDPQKSKRRKCLEGYSLNVVGLYPETKRRNCRTETSAVLAPLQSKVVARVMPDESARVDLWHSIGGCVDMSASKYFRTITNYADRLKVPTELLAQQTHTVASSSIRQNFVRLNQGLPLQSVHLECEHYKAKPYLTGLKVCYDANGRYRACGSEIQSNCPTRVTIQGSY